MAWSAQDLRVEWGRPCKEGKSVVVLQTERLLAEQVTTGSMARDNVMFNTTGTGNGGNSIIIIEKQRMWNGKCTIIPIIGAPGIVTKSLTKNLEAIPGKHSTDSLQKTAILGTSHIIRKVL
jgi:hypothetical protein